ncbi:MAG: hypothetical protein J0H19_16055, partial [Rhodospirillales bacterium]|nr:hypothetical protein [Rhodospirillales bacterium]
MTSSAALRARLADAPARALAAALAVAPLAAFSPAAHADAPPRIQPTRDVTVTYRVLSDTTIPAGMPRPTSLRISFAAGGTRVRVEPGNGPMYLLLDRTAQRLTIVIPPQHSLMDLPYDPSRDPQRLATDARFTRRGEATVAGLRCTEWDVRTRDGTGSACLTADGVLLRGSGAVSQQHGGIEATEVSYAPIPADALTPPQGFQRLEMPQLRLPQAG